MDLTLGAYVSNLTGEEYQEQAGYRCPARLWPPAERQF